MTFDTIDNELSSQSDTECNLPNNIGQDIFSKPNSLQNILVGDSSSSFIENYSCLLCSEVLYNKQILQCINGHHACKNCFDVQLSIHNECMVCKTPIKSIKELSRCLFVENQISKQKIKCPFTYRKSLFSSKSKSIMDRNQFELIYKDRNGCSDEISIGLLDDHLKECSSRFVNCSNNENGCNQIIRFKNLSTHLEMCGYSIIKCEYCKNEFKKRELEDHYKICSSIEIQCDQCSITVKRGELDQHIELDCPNTIITCRYSGYGCNDQFKRCELDQHYQQQNHTRFITELIQGQSLELLNARNEIKLLNVLISQVTKLATTKNDQLVQSNNEISQLNNSIFEFKHQLAQLKDDQLVQSNNEINKLNGSILEYKLQLEQSKNEIELLKQSELKYHQLNTSLLNRFEALESRFNKFKLNNSKSYSGTWIISNYSYEKDIVYSNKFIFNGKEFHLGFSPIEYSFGPFYISFFGDSRSCQYYTKAIIVNNISSKKDLRSSNIKSFSDISKCSAHQFKYGDRFTQDNGFISTDNKLTIRFKIREGLKQVKNNIILSSTNWVSLLTQTK